MAGSEASSSRAGMTIEKSVSGDFGSVFKLESHTANMLGKRSAGFFATKDHIELKERLFSVFFVILRGYTNFKTALASGIKSRFTAGR